MQELEGSAIAAFYCNVEDYLDLNDQKKAQTELVFTAMTGLGDEVLLKKAALIDTDFPVSDPASDVVGRAISEEARPAMADRRRSALAEFDSPGPR